MKRRIRQKKQPSTPLVVPVLLLVLLGALVMLAVKKNPSFVMQAQTNPTGTFLTPTLAPFGTPTPTLRPISPTPRPMSPTPRPISPTPQPSLAPNNLLKNASFELDANSDTRPDNWSTNSRVIRSKETMNQGFYSMKHYGTDNSSYTITQTVSNLSAGKRYTFSGWVNIPATSDSFTFSLQVRWRDSDNDTIRTDTVRSFTSATAGWNYSVANGLLAPSETTNAQIIQRVSSLNAKIYTDNFSFRPY